MKFALFARITMDTKVLPGRLLLYASPKFYLGFSCQKIMNGLFLHWNKPLAKC